MGGYLSQSSGRFCEVDIASVDASEVKVTFVEDPSVWKCIPVSMVLSEKNPLKFVEPRVTADNDVVDLDEGSDCSRDGSVSPRPAEVKAASPKKASQWPEWIAAGERIGYLS